MKQLVCSKRGKRPLRPVRFMWDSQDWVACYTISDGKDFVYTGVHIRDIEGGLPEVVAALPAEERGGPRKDEQREDPPAVFHDATAEECRTWRTKPAVKTKPKRTLPAVNMGSGSGMSDIGI